MVETEAIDVSKKKAATQMRLDISIKRAGADMIINYWAKDVARWLGA